MNKENPLNIARLLGKSIQSSPEYRGLQDAYDQLLGDNCALNLLEKQRSLKHLTISNRDSTESYKMELERIENKIATNKVIQAYYEQKKSYTKLLNNINGIINHYIESFTLNNQGCQCSKKCHK